MQTGKEKATAQQRGHAAARMAHAQRESAAAPFADCLQQGGLLWKAPYDRPMSWYAANEICQQGIAGDSHWRLPSSTELVRLFRHAHQAWGLDSSWPTGFYWSLTMGMNGCHQLVHRIHAVPYVHDNDRASFHVVLVRRLYPVQWSLAT